ncbi:MAG: AraC family transcriptional regulator [Bacteroidaceae bacterium]|nr:AraC family transcriptional regulator [Bacteroidaceae bacterium]
MRRKKEREGQIKDLFLNEDSTKNPSIDFTDGGDFAISTHIADILISEHTMMRSQMNVLVLCTQGTALVDINGNSYNIKANQVLICPSHMLVGNFSGSTDFKAKALCLSDRLLYGILGDKIEAWVRAIYIENMIQLTLAKSECRRIEYYSKLSRSIMDDVSIVYRSDLLRIQLEALVLELCSKYASSGVRQEVTVYSKSVFFRFFRLLAEAKVKRNPVGSYANQLGVTPKYLSYVCDKFSGLTALDWIDKFVMEDVRYYLKSTNCGIKEVSDKLGFSNNSFFGRYVVRHVGMSPIAYRRFLRK